MSTTSKSGPAAASDKRPMFVQIAGTSPRRRRLGRKLAAHARAPLKVLAEIRRLTEFPKRPSRPIGFTADISGGRKD